MRKTVIKCTSLSPGLVLESAALKSKQAQRLGLRKRAKKVLRLTYCEKSRVDPHIDPHADPIILLGPYDLLSNTSYRSHLIKNTRHL